MPATGATARLVTTTITTQMYYSNGLMLNGELGTAGGERLLDSRTATPAGTWQKRGDASLNHTPSPGGTAGWIDTADGANFRPFGPVANDTGGTQWNLPIVINTLNTFATLPACTASLKGAHQFITDGAASPSFAAAAAGGGSLFLPVYCDGTIWRNG